MHQKRSNEHSGKQPMCVPSILALRGASSHLLVDPCTAAIYMLTLQSTYMRQEWEPHSRGSKVTLKSDPSRQQYLCSARGTESEIFWKIRHTMAALQLSYGTIWWILQKRLKWKAYKPHLAQVLSLDKESSPGMQPAIIRVTEDWFQLYDEKWCVKLSCASGPWNQINDLMGGKIHPVVWFEGSANSGIPGASAEGYSVACSEGFSHQASVLVPTRWYQTVTWLFHASSSWCQSLGTMTFLSGHKPRLNYAGANIPSCMN